MQKSYVIQVTGRVQGVGFRPLVYNVACALNLNGEVTNNEKGVLIKINADRNELARFLQALKEKKPAHSVIGNISYRLAKPSKFETFSIRKQNTSKYLNLPLTPDLAICKNCKSEIIDSNNRRHHYAFISCTDCGPRYSITHNFPFDRENSSLKQFKMCSGCHLEYSDPGDRRFHSQTNTCSQCGIELNAFSNKPNSFETSHTNILKSASEIISKGGIIAIKNISGYLLCCDAQNATAIKTLRQRKNRPSKPFAIVVPDIDYILSSFSISEPEKIALISEVAPIVIIDSKNYKGKIKLEVIAPKLNSIGIMLPSSALLYLLMQEIRSPIIATSGNIHGSPIISNRIEAEDKLTDIVDGFVHHDLDINFPQDDSVIKFYDNQPIVLRRSRGMAPNFSKLNNPSDKTILAMGAHLKSTFAYSPNDYCYISQTFGNLGNYDVSQRYLSTLEKYFTMFGKSPEIILYDKNPTYQSHHLGKELAEQFKAEIFQIQHHKAHLAAVLAEHDLFKSPDKILGVIWDGTGLGEDNHIWGGEFFSYYSGNIERINHFDYYDWIVGNKMAFEPRISLLSLTKDANINFPENKFSRKEYDIYTKLLRNNKLKTASVGRLFDAVASALDLIDISSYEGEASMILETVASNYLDDNPLNFLEGENYDKIPSKLIIEKVIQAIETNLAKERIAFSFIFTLAKCIIQLAIDKKFQVIACSGGVFQNSILCTELQKLSEIHNFSLKINRNLSSNDENISFGQLMYFMNIHDG